MSLRLAGLRLVGFACCFSPASAQQPAAADAGAVATADIARIVQAKIRPCWNLPKGAAAIVGVRVQMSPDGVPANAEIVDRAKLDSDQNYRAFANAALRAVANPLCQPWPLPRESYNQWRTLIINFDSRDFQ